MDLSGSCLLKEGIENCLVHHCNDVVSSVGDERDFLRLWRRRWRDAVDGENTRLLRFLRSYAEISDADFMSKIADSLPGNGWFTRHIQNDIFDLSGVILELESKLGIPYESLRQTNHRAYDLYASTIRKLFDCEDSLNAKLATIKGIQEQLESFKIVDLSGPEAAELQSAIINYIRGIYRTHAIEESYKEFISCYAEWQALRNIVLGKQVADMEARGSPLCSICTTEKISAVLIPCGHTFCNNCTQRQKSMCYVCRCPVKERMRIYFA